MLAQLFNALRKQLWYNNPLTTLKIAELISFSTQNSIVFLSLSNGYTQKSQNQKLWHAKFIWVKWLEKFQASYNIN